MMRCDVGASVRSPNIIVPRQMRDTSSPLLPNRRYSIAIDSSPGEPAVDYAATARTLQCGGEKRHVIIRSIAVRWRTADLSFFFPMHVFFEDDGQLKAGTVLADHDASLQIEAV